MIANTDNTWGWPAKLLHWIGAILISCCSAMAGG